MALSKIDRIFIAEGRTDVTGMLEFSGSRFNRFVRSGVIRA